jgi:hypothetical protein
MTGSTKYGWRRIFKGYLDMIGLWFWYRYSPRPLHFFGAISIVFFCSGSVLLCLGVIAYFAFDQHFTKVLPLSGLFLLVQSTQFLVSGLLAQLISKNYFKDTLREPFKIIDKEVLLKVKK